MYELQRLIFRSASQWPEAISLVVLAAGLLYLLQGFRFARFLLPVTCGAGGLVLGTIAAAAADLPLVAGWVPAVVLAIVALLRFRVGLAISSAFVAGMLAQYLAVQVGVRSYMSLLVGAVGLLLGVSLFWMCRRTLPILVTIIQGAALLVVGFVGITAVSVPSLGLTFVEWAGRLSLMVPVLLAMLCTLGYSVQSNAFQGDIESGGSSAVRDLELQ